MSAAETHSDGNEIACPHCGKVMRDLWDYHWSNNDDCIDTECGWCEEPITLSRVVSVDYTCKVRQ